jgi:hypothetical protein
MPHWGAALSVVLRALLQPLALRREKLAGVWGSRILERGVWPAPHLLTHSSRRVTGTDFPRPFSTA